MKTHFPGRSPGDRAEEFLRTAHLYRLGALTTEQPHPDTRELSRWARQDLPRAIETLKKVDLRALKTLQRYAPHVDGLAAAIKETLDRGRRVYLCGCGATGRLSMSLEFLWRRRHGDDDRVRSFMAGGDVALVHALEGFEDHPAYGARHLEEMGFEDGDLLVSCTEGGETPYVIGATERAAEISSNPPYFLYCNPDAVLALRIDRFRRVHENGRIRKVCLFVGPMGLTGSTRMQASTVLQLAVGLALLHATAPAAEPIGEFAGRIERTDFAFLAGFIERESCIYEAGHHVTYRVADFGITVLTDTTERAPTFGLAPFDQLREPLASHSPCYVELAGAEDSDGAWTRLLGRQPRALDWPEVDPRTSPEYLRGFDFSDNAGERRRLQIPGREHHEFRIHGPCDDIAFEMGGLQHVVPAAGMPELFRHLLLKQMLNIHSTLVMGRIGRYEGNLMTWVTPTNGKLVDRAARYVEHLLETAGRPGFSYRDIVHRLFAEMELAEPGSSVVRNTCRSLMGRRAAS